MRYADLWKRYAGKPMPFPFGRALPRPPTCEVCGKPAPSALDFLYWPSTPERPLGDGVYHVVHPDCTDTLVATFEKTP